MSYIYIYIYIYTHIYIYIYIKCIILMFLDHTKRRSTVGRTPLDELIARPEESYRLCCVVLCDLETSRICTPYIYDISTLRVKYSRRQHHLSTTEHFTPVCHVKSSVRWDSFHDFLANAVTPCYTLRSLDRRKIACEM
jgi:hypothetical protein